MRSVPINLPKQPKPILGKLEKRSAKKRALGTVDPRRLAEEKTPSHGFTKVCIKCDSVYYDKKWYTKEELARHLEKREELKGKKFENWFREELKKAKRVICEADKQRKDWSEGVVILDGLNSKIKREVLNLVKNIDREGRKNDMEDKIVAMEDLGERVVIYTSENQLAHRIGKQVASAFKGGKLEYKFSNREEAARIYWQAPEMK